MKLKENFENYFSELFGERYESIKARFMTYKRQAIRVNSLKANPNNVFNSLTQKGFILKRMPWFENGFFVEHKPFAIGNSLEHSVGQIYVQDASSMLPPLVLDPKPDQLILDVASAPGSKTTQMAAMMQNTGLIVANDVSGSRLSVLAMNLQRLGVKNTITVMSDAMRFDFGLLFDKILVDAPCSAIGTIALDETSPAKMWNPKSWKKLSRIQYRILNNVWNYLKRGGELVYSTCSIDPMEDEFVANKFLINHDDADVVDVNIEKLNSTDPILKFKDYEFDFRIKHSLRILPDDNNTEGFYIIKFRKIA